MASLPAEDPGRGWYRPPKEELLLSTSKLEYLGAVSDSFVRVVLRKTSMAASLSSCTLTTVLILALLDSWLDLASLMSSISHLYFVHVSS